MIAKRFVVTGTVQGVFFRTYTKAKANELGLVGWVRNCEDGSVEVHAEGTEAQLLALESWLHRGPPAAKVEEVTSKKVPQEQCTSFEIAN